MLREKQPTVGTVKKPQKLRDNNEMTALECIEPFLNHNCYLDHTGSSQVWFF